MATEQRGNARVTSRIPEEVIERLDRVAAAMTREAIPGSPVPERGDALRATVLAGLPLLEARLGIASEAPAPKAKKGTKTPRKA